MLEQSKANSTSNRCTELTYYRERGIYEAIGGILGCSGTLISQQTVLSATHCFCPQQNSTENCLTRTVFTLPNATQ